jgi:hypothetical protein
MVLLKLLVVAHLFDKSSHILSKLPPNEFTGNLLALDSVVQEPAMTALPQQTPGRSDRTHALDLNGTCAKPRGMIDRPAAITSRCGRSFRRHHQLGYGINNVGMTYRHTCNPTAGRQP